MAIASNGVVTFSQVPVFPNDTVETADIQDNAVTLAKMAGLARGKIIYGDSSGDPAALAVGTNGYVLTSDGTDISWTEVSASSLAADNLSAGDAAVTLTTSSGNITIDAAANNSDIIFKGTDGGSDITMLTLDGSDAGAAIFSDQISANSFNLPITLNATDGSASNAGDNIVQNTAANENDRILYEDATTDPIAVLASHGITLSGQGWNAFQFDNG